MVDASSSKYCFRMARLRPESSRIVMSCGAEVDGWEGSGMWAKTSDYESSPIFAFAALGGTNPYKGGPLA